MRCDQQAYVSGVTVQWAVGYGMQAVADVCVKENEREGVR